MESLLLLEVHGTIFLDCESDVTIFNLHIDRGIYLLLEFAFGTFYCHNAIVVLADSDTCGDANWQFSYS